MFKQGSIIYYRLDLNNTSKGIPVDIWKVWKGKVLRSTIGDPCSLPGAIVVSLEPGYEELAEFIPIGRMLCYENPKEQ